MRKFLITYGLFSGFVFLAVSAQAQETKVAECVVQLVRANMERIQMAPETETEKKVTLVQSADGHYLGATSYKFSPDRPGAQSFQVELSLKLEPNRSTWNFDAPRIYTTTLLRNEEGTLLAMGVEHSDRVLTPTMANWIIRGEGPRVITRLYNSTLLQELNASGGEELNELILTDSDAAVTKGWKSQAIPSDAAYLVDTICILQ